MSACDKVLNLPELLECVLEHLPMRDLLLVQRVSKTWQTVIKLQPLQRKLFFLEIPGGPLKLVHTPIESPFPGTLHDDQISRMGILDLEEYNRSIYHPQGKGLTQVANIEYMWTSEEGSGLGRRPVPIHENPVFTKLHAQLDKMSAPDHPLVSLPECWERPEASWRRMLITQPPFVENKVHMWVVRADQGIGLGWEGTEYAFEQRLGTMVDDLRTHARKWFFPGFHAMLAFYKGCVAAGLYIEINGRELWEAPQDEGWSKVHGNDIGSHPHNMILDDQVETWWW